jgi:sugar transferase (PEP-CTERM/EpsH1 system associated)
MRILYITSNLPYPPSDGPRIRLFAFLKHFAPRHRVLLASFIRPHETIDSVKALKDICGRVHVVPHANKYAASNLVQGAIGSLPFGVLHYRHPEMFQGVSRIIDEEQPDIIQVEAVQMAQYCLAAPSVKVLDLHNIESLLMKRYSEREPNLFKRHYADMTWRKLLAYERAIYPSFARILTCSKEEREQVSHVVRDSPVRVIPNGVDIETFDPGAVIAAAASPEVQRLVFVGKMDYHANVDAVCWFCETILPLILARNSHVQFHIVGAYPVKAVLALESRHVRVEGAVEDVRPYLKAASVVVVPLRVGGGTRFKVVEALAMGKAMVTTAVGCEGIVVRHGREALIADEPREFAEHVLALLQDDQLRARFRAAGRRLVADRYSWPAICGSLEQTYEEIGSHDR